MRKIGGSTRIDNKNKLSSEYNEQDTFVLGKKNKDKQVTNFQKKIKKTYGFYFQQKKKLIKFEVLKKIIKKSLTHFDFAY